MRVSEIEAMILERGGDKTFKRRGYKIFKSEGDKCKKASR